MAMNHMAVGLSVGTGCDIITVKAITWYLRAKTRRLRFVDGQGALERDYVTRDPVVDVSATSSGPWELPKDLTKASCSAAVQ